MCTALTLKKGNLCVFGRNMDLEYEWGQQVVVTPRNFIWPMRFLPKMRQKYAIIGMAMPYKDSENGGHDYPLYAEAANEKGLACAGLNFPANAYYPDPGKTKKEKGQLIEITPYEVVHWVLANFSSVKEVKKFFNENTIAIVNKPISKEVGITTLHFIVSDKDGAFVFEPCVDGVKYYDNPLGILSNNPTFDWQLTNLSYYQNLCNSQNFPSDCKFMESASGQGFGGLGLPGDVTPPSRFIRTVFYKTYSVPEENIESLVNEHFHILSSVEMIKGSVIVGKTKDNKPIYDITLYSSCIDLNKMVYFYKTYWNSQINAVDMYALGDAWLNGDQIAVYPFIKQQSIKFLNK